MARDSREVTQLSLPLTHQPTDIYSPATEHHCPLAATLYACPWRDGQAKLTWVAGYILRQIFPHRD